MGRLRTGLVSLVRNPWRLAALLGVTAALVFVVPQAIAWYHFRAGHSALEHYHTAVARAHFDACLKTWPSSAEGHLLAARAARRDGDLDAAQSHLQDCQRLQGVNPQTTFEWSLLHAAAGDLDEVERDLQKQLRDPARAPLVREALIQGYLRLSRPHDALLCVEDWLGQDPNHVQALYLRGNLWRHVQALNKAIPDYRQVLELDRARDDARWWLAVCLQEGGRDNEAQKLLEELRPRRPGDTDLAARLALCYRRSRPAEARALLQGVLAQHPDHPLALRALGELEIDEGKAQDAEKSLRRAAEVNPYDYRTQWALGKCLQQLPGREAEARTQRARSEKLKEQLERLGEIRNRKLSARPRDPDLTCELGRLLIELGHREEGLRWLERTLTLDLQHKGAHAALAAWYREQGATEKADFHARQAEAPKQPLQPDAPQP
jgi:tetratricopeptide (TPR) repeat protein